MRRAAPAGVLLCSLVSALVGCGSDTPTSSSPASNEYALAPASSQSCTPKTKPGKIVDKVVTPPAWGIAVRDDGLAYFAEPFDDAVGITSTTSRTIMGTIPTGPGSHPLGLAFSPDGSTAYVTNLFTNDVGVIDVASARQVGTIPTGDASPFVVRVSPDGEQLFVATNGNLVFIVSTATREIVKTVEVGFAPNAFAVHPDGRMMYVSAFLGGTVSEVDMFTGTVIRTFFVGGVPQDMALNRKGTHLFVANEIGVLNEIDLFTGASLPDIPLAGGGFGVGVTPDDGEAYVAEPANGLVQIFTLQTRKLSRQINVGGEPRRIAFSQQGRIGAISNMAGYITFVR
jgi:YVTN family beta-propeller protein